MSIPNWFNYMMGGGGGGGRTVTKKKKTVTTESVEIDDDEGPGASGPGGNGGGDGNGPGGDGNGGENGPGGGGDGPEDGNEDDHEDDREDEEESQETGQNGEDEADDDDDDDDGGTELGTVVYSAHLIPYGTILTDDHVYLGVYPKDHITQKMLTGIGQAVGKIASRDISAHTVLTSDMLDSPHYYVIAATEIRAGRVIRSEDLARSPFARSSPSRFEDERQVIGRRAARTIPPNTAITKSMLK